MRDQSKLNFRTALLVLAASVSFFGAQAQEETRLSSQAVLLDLDDTPSSVPDVIVPDCAKRAISACWTN